MADVNAPIEQAPAVAPPTRTDEQILPRIRWVPIGKSNCYLDAEKSQSNPIYKIAMDILKHTNFFRAFIASSTIPAIYIQQLCDTICYDRTDGGYKCQLDEEWFNLTKDTLRDALQITPVDKARAPSVADSLGVIQSVISIMRKQRAIKEKLKDAYGATLGVLSHRWLFRETDMESLSTTSRVEGKGKEKVGAEQAARGSTQSSNSKEKEPS
ncbi:hypothetical protein Tco_1272729 [Tanacetum coccineum]